MQTLSLYDDSLIWAGLFRNKSVNRSRILQEFFPTSSLLSFPKRVSLESCFLIRHPNLGNKVRNSFQRHFLPVCVLSPSSSEFLWDLQGIFSSYSPKKERLGLYQFCPSLCKLSISRWLCLPAVMSSLEQEMPCAHLPWQLEMSQKQRDFKDHLVPAPLACSIHVSGLAL